MKTRLLTMLLVLSLLLSGCMAATYEFKVNEDGSGNATVQVGYLETALAEFQKEFPDAETPPEGELQKFTLDGATYLGQVETLDFEDTAQLNTLLEGVATLTKESNGFSLIIFGDAQSAVEDGLELPEEIEAEGLQELLESMIWRMSFSFPYSVRQVGGPKELVTINGTSLFIDMMKRPAGDNADLVFDISSLQAFTDVADSAWYTEAINAMHAKGLINGYGDGRFGPHDNLTVAALCQILARAYDLPTGAADTGYWAYSAISACLECGWIEGRGPIAPQNYDVPATREVGVAAITRAGENSTISSTTKIPDIEAVSDVYKQDIIQAYASGICNGKDKYGTFDPLGLLTRAEVCQMFYRMNWEG